MLKKITLLATLILGACGGGGKNDDIELPSSQTLRFTSATPTLILLERADLVDPRLRDKTGVAIAYTGTSKLPVAFIVEEPEKIIGSIVPHMADGVAYLSLGINPRLKFGIYTKPLKVHVCVGTESAIVNYEYKCTNEYPGSPIVVERNFNIIGLDADKTVLNFTAAANTQPEEQVITVPINRRIDSARWNTLQNQQMQQDYPGFGIADNANDAFNSQIAAQFGFPMIVGNQIKIQPQALPAGHYEALLDLRGGGPTFGYGLMPQFVKINYDVF